MNDQPGPQRPRVRPRLPHPSWNLDRPILLAPDESAQKHRPGERRKVTPEDIWALVDAAG
jgi:hypothetical protein